MTDTTKKRAKLLDEQAALANRIRELQAEFAATRKRQRETDKEMRRLNFVDLIGRANAVRVQTFSGNAKFQHFSGKSVTLINVRQSRGTVDLNGQLLDIQLEFLAIGGDRPALPPWGIAQ